MHDRLLVGEQIARRESPGATVHVGAREELRRVSLDRLGWCPLPVRGRPRHHRLAFGERVLLLGQPARSGQLDAHPPPIANLDRTRRSTRQRLKVARTEAMLGRPRAHDVTPRRRVDPVTLASARGVRDRLTPPIPDQDARRHQLAVALHDLTTTRGELVQHLRR
jgi:hypothetical protein